MERGHNRHAAPNGVEQQREEAHVAEQVERRRLVLDVNDAT
jgi:hypothetical protein